MLTFRSFAATDEGHPEEAERRAREAKALVDRFRLQGIPQAIWRPSRWDVRSQDTEAGGAGERYSARQSLPGLSPGPPSSGC